MKKTTFHTGRNILVMIQQIKKGNPKAESAIVLEITRLENRIMELETGKGTDKYISPEEIEL